ncbi:hypothetical protein ACWD0G_30815, partial [Streptomyces goshikiensis]
MPLAEAPPTVRPSPRIPNASLSVATWSVSWYWSASRGGTSIGSFARRAAAPALWAPLRLLPPTTTAI